MNKFIPPMDKFSNIFVILKSVLISYLITAILFFVFSIIITYTNFSENFITPLIVIISGFSVLIGGIITGRVTKTMGLINGAITGFCYMLILYAFSAVFVKGFIFDAYVVFMFILGIISGIVGGVIGVNSKK